MVAVVAVAAAAAAVSEGGKCEKLRPPSVHQPGVHVACLHPNPDCCRDIKSSLGMTKVPSILFASPRTWEVV
ncbi:hypothetical protein RJ641_015863 [Dillenia turbinata]|uniref:Uncharacterized protein n=1 Tax=Dillenia turbinata TaxID=194707 RepID=A0AAN8USR5_9MAGN